MELVIPERGDLYRVAFHGQGHVLRNPHYAVVVSDDTYNRLSSVVVVPFSSGARAYSFRPETVINGNRTRALVDQVMAIDKRFLRDHVGSLAGQPALDEIDFYLRDLLALSSDNDWP